MSFTKGIESVLESRRRAREAREYCEQHNIPLSPEYETDNTAHISAQSPDSGPYEAYYCCLEVVQTYQKLAEKLFRWRPPAELNQKMAFAFKGEVEFYKPIIDEKYRQYTPAWGVTQIRNIWHGKHVAASMSSTSLDEKTKRDLTREQVGDGCCNLVSWLSGCRFWT